MERRFLRIDASKGVHVSSIFGERFVFLVLYIDVLAVFVTFQHWLHALELLVLIFILGVLFLKLRTHVAGLLDDLVGPVLLLPVRDHKVRHG